MAIINLDPGDVVGGFFGRVIFGLILFCAAGFIGTFSGILCSEFTEWADFADLNHLFGGDFSLSGSEFVLLTTAPFFIPFNLGLIGTIFFIFNAVAFWRLLFTEDDPWFWALGVAFGCTLGGAADNPFSWPTLLLTVLLSIGYAALAWYLLKRQNPGIVEDIGEYLEERFGNSPDDEDD